MISKCYTDLVLCSLLPLLCPRPRGIKWWCCLTSVWLAGWCILADRAQLGRPGSRLLLHASIAGLGGGISWRPPACSLLLFSHQHSSHTFPIWVSRLISPVDSPCLWQTSLETLCTPVTDGWRQNKCLMVCSNQSIPGLLYVLIISRRFDWIIIITIIVIIITLQHYLLGVCQVCIQTASGHIWIWI